MPDGVAKDKLKVFLSDIRTLIDWLKTNQKYQMNMFKQVKVNTWESKLGWGLIWQSMVTWFFAFEMMRRQDVHMSELTYTDDDIPAMRERNTVPRIWEEWMKFGSYGETVDIALMNEGNRGMLEFHNEVGREFKLASMKLEGFRNNH